MLFKIFYKFLFLFHKFLKPSRHFAFKMDSSAPYSDVSGGSIGPS